MNLTERIIVFLLAAFDRCMDVITLGLWTRVRGEVSWLNIKVKRG